MKPSPLRLMLCATILTLMATYFTSAKGAAAFSVPQPPGFDPVPTSGEFPSTTAPNGLVDVGGRRLMFHCIGHGSPTIILEAGMGATSNTWFQVQTGGDSNYRVCSYDRANLGKSEGAPKPRTYLDMARDLHALLVNAAISGPYILVGHSGGGLIVRMFADQYPEEVVGLVLVDSAHPDMGPRLIAGLPPKSWFESKAIRSWRIWLSWMSNSHGSIFREPEGLDTKTSNDQVKAARPLGDLPLVVISRSPDNTTLEGQIDLPSETNAKMRKIWQELQNELAGWSSNSTHVIADHSGHWIPTEEPELIIESIQKLVGEARSQMGVINPAAEQTQTEHTPKILRVAERQEWRKGWLNIYKDVYFIDNASDAVYGLTSLVSANPPLEWKWPGGFITASASEQKGEAIDVTVWACDKVGNYVIEERILDQSFNLSEPVTLSFTCPARRLYISPSLILGLAIGLIVLAVVIWLLRRHHRARLSAVSTS